MSDLHFPLQPFLHRKDLFIPDMAINISKVLPSALKLFNYQFPIDQTLLPFLQKKNGWHQVIEGEVTNILFIILDALGLKQFMNNSAFLRKTFDSHGIALSSVFPTISSTCITSLRLGKMPIDHGIVGHKIHFPEIGNMVDTLTLFAKDSSVDLSTAGVNIRNWLWSDFPIEKDVEQIGIIEGYIANSGFSKLVEQKDSVIGYSSVNDCFAAAKTVLEKSSPKNRFVDVYIGSIDAITHRYTTDSLVLKDEIENIEHSIVNLFERLDPQVAQKTAVFITADHGQENLSMENRIVIKPEEEKDLESLLKFRGRSGRVIHLYSQEGKQDEVVEWFTKKIGENGVVITPKSYPLLMGKNADRLEVVNRLGDIQIILGEKASMYFGHSGEYDQHYNLGLNATHGSLSKDELLVPLLFGRVSDLAKECKKKE